MVSIANRDPPFSAAFLPPVAGRFPMYFLNVDFRKIIE
jgi:hypothetical protein